MDIKEKATKLYEDFKKPSIQLALKFVGPVLLKGLKSLLTKAKERLERIEEAKRTQTPEPTEEGQEHPETVATDETTVASEVMKVDFINVPVETPQEITWYPSPNYS